MATAAATPGPDAHALRKADLLREALATLQRHTDRMFAALMALQWLAGIGVALWLSPRVWEGLQSSVHLHVWAALFLGGLITSLPVALALFQPGRVLTRHVVAVGQMLMSALLIHLTGGRIETHFHVFGSLAFLAFYRDWRVLVSASAVVALDHFLRGAYWPQSVFGLAAAQPWRWLEHAGWVVFEDAFLFISIRQSCKEMAAAAARQARLEEVNESIERTVAQRTEELTREVANRTRSEQALLQAKEAAETANRSKSTFLATMSHEIRTPMNGVLGMAELLSHTELNADQREQLAMIHHSGESLLVVINDILDFSKIEAGRMEFEQLGFSLHELFGRTLQALSPQASAKGLEIELEIPADLPDLRRGDPARLRQVLTNLVGNAVKFTSQGWIRVVVSPGEGPDGLRVEVVDTGVGIEPDAQEKLFRPFSQVDASTTRKHGGTGLGLAICARILELMGGRIGVQSQPRRGSTFWFELALPPVEEGEVHSLEDRMPETLGELAGASVLLVDDNAVNRMVAGAQMRRWGMRVEEAAGAIEALAKLRDACRPGQAGYDVAVLDGTMPVMDGWQLGSIIRQTPGCERLPLIMVSSLGLGTGHLRPEARLFHRVLQKPLRPTQLAGVLAEVLTGWQTAAPAGKAKPMPKGRQALRILLVEDSVINQRVARSMLEKGGHQVTIAENGVHALEKLEEPDHFDIILMDCQMPEMDGFETTRRFRRRETERGWKRCRVVAMTANAMQGDEEACLAAGMDDYLAKPVRMEVLLAAVGREY